MTVGLFAALAIVFGPVVLPYLLIQAVLGFSLLEVVNYLEHYGLLRQKKEDGRYERCLPEHSWNSNNVASNVLLYHLQRHSDHHANPTRRYQALRHVDEAPQLPTGYAGMIVLAWFPPLWRRVMDPRLLEHYDGDVSRANIQPRKRAPGPRPLRGARRRERLALPRLRLRLRRGGRATRARASRPGRRGARSPTTGPAPTAACATRSTSSPSTRRRVTAAAATMAATATGARPPTRRRPASCCARPCSAPPATSSSSAPGRRSRCPTSPRAAGVSRQTLYKEFGSRDEFAPGLRDPRGRALPRRRRGGGPRAPRRSRAPRSAPPSRPSCAPPARTRWSGSCSATTAPAACCPSSPPRGCRSSTGRPPGSRRVIQEGWPQAPADEGAAARRVPGPAGDQLHHRPQRLAARRPRPRAGELLGPFIDEALGTRA